VRRRVTCEGRSLSRFSTRRVGALIACALLFGAVPARSAHARQLEPSTVTFRVSLQGSYTATVTAPSDCQHWVPVDGPEGFGIGPDGFGIGHSPATASATETASFHSTAPATVSWAGPYAHFPLSTEGDPPDRTGRTSVSLQRSSNLHEAQGLVEGCSVGDSPSSPPTPDSNDCGSRALKTDFGASNVKLARTNRSKVSVTANFFLSDPYQACFLPGAVQVGNFQGKAGLAAIRATRPLVSRLFSGSRRIVEHGSATVHGVGTDPGSAVTYTLTLKITLTRTKLHRARFG
jgi:hypothetical protein